MTFEEVVDQALAMLQRRGRVTYRMLKRQFDLDDEVLEDLRLELIKGQRLAGDEDGDVLVWIGDAAVAPSPAPVPPPPPLAYTPSYLAEKILTSRIALEGERKQVTVLFADLKGSTELIRDLDPEQAQALLDPALHLMMDAVHRVEGTVNQVLGDGIMALFGAPVAHEDHAVRACYAALAMQTTLCRYADEVRRSHGLEIQARVGLNSGEVVVRAIDSSLHIDYSAVGQTTHLTARMEQLATPGSIRLTAATLRLAEGLVQVTALGQFPVKGLPEPVDVFELVGANAVRRRLQASAARGLTRFVGRQQELTILQQALEQAGAVQGQVVALVAEAGVGKSRLAYEFVHAHRTSGWLVLESASVSYGKATPYFPVIDLLKRYGHLEEHDDSRTIRAKVTGQVCTLDPALQDAVPALLSLLDAVPEDNPFVQLDPPQRRQRTHDALKRLFPAQEFTFAHALTHEVAYGSLLRERRRVLHGRIVEAIERLSADRLTEQVERLAHHALRGEVWDKALAYCREAGEKAVARSAYREAVGYCEQALNALAHLPETRDRREQALALLLTLRAALGPIGDYKRMLACLREAEALATALDDAHRLAQVLSTLSLHCCTGGEYAQALVVTQRALELAMAHGAVVEQAQAHLFLTRASYHQGNYRQAIDCCKHARAALEGMSPHERFGGVFPPVVSACGWLAWCHAELGTFTEGRVLGEEGLRIAEAVAHPASLAYAYNGLGVLVLRQGDLSRALPLLERAVRICLDANLLGLSTLYGEPLGAAYTLGGRVADALPLLTQAREQLMALARVDFQARCYLALGEAHLLTGHLEEAHALAERALTHTRTYKERGNEAYALRLLGEMAVRCDPLENERAGMHYRQALTLAEELGMRPLMAHCHQGLGRLYAAMGQQEQARAALSTAIKLYRAMEMTFWLPETEAALAQVEGR